MNLFGVIFEDEDLLVVNKPAGLVCHPTKGDVFSSLISRARIYLSEFGVRVLPDGPSECGMEEKEAQRTPFEFGVRSAECGMEEKGQMDARPHPNPMASQARHESVPPNEMTASRFVVPQERGKQGERQSVRELEAPMQVSGESLARRGEEVKFESRHLDCYQVQKGEKLESPYVGCYQPQLINRLDRETSGVVVLAKNETAARGLRKLWEGRLVHKQYLAIVHGEVASDAGVIEASLGKDVSSRVAIKDCVRADGAAARTEFRVLRRFVRGEGGVSLLEVTPVTGRKHQIRIHLAHVGHPIVGDKLYGGDEDLYMALVEGRLTEEQRRRLILPWQGLHAGEVRLTWQNREYVFKAEPEPWFTEFAELNNEATK